MNKITLTGWITAIFLFTLPFVSSRLLFFPAVNSKFLYILGFIAIVGLVSVAVMFIRKPPINFGRRWLLLALGVVLFIHYLSALWGVFPVRSFWSDITRSSGVLFLTGIVFTSLILSELLSVQDWQLARRAVAISGAIFSFFTILSVDGFGLSGRLFSVINLDISGLTFGNSTFAGAYLVLVLIITLIETVRSSPQSRARKIFSLLALIQFLSPLLISFSLQILGSARASGATAILIILFVGGWCLLRRFWPQGGQKYVLGAWSGLFVVGMVVSVGLLFVSGSWVQEKYIKASSAARIVVWKSGLQAFKERPILGWGPENFRLAFEQNFDNRLYQNDYQGEIWFDRAHNLIVDTLVSVGVVGGVSVILFGILFVVVVIRAKKRGLIGEGEAVLLSIIPFAHFLQLQTAFDTIATYALGGVIVGYVLWLEKPQIIFNPKAKPVSDLPIQRYLLASISVIICVGSLSMLITEYGRQKSLFNIFITENGDRQLELASRALARTDMEALRFSSGSMIKGLLAQIAEAKSPDPNLNKIGLRQLTAYETHFKSYLAVQPNDYRIRMNYARLLIIKTVLGENRLKEAQMIIQDSYKLSPNNPLTYALEAITELYGGKVIKAKEKIKEGIALNPQIDFSQEILAYIEKQEKNFPVITVIKLENL